MSSIRMQVRGRSHRRSRSLLRIVRALAALVDDGERRVDAPGEAARADHTADIGRDHHELGELVAPASRTITGEGGGFSERLVDRNIEEALNLRGVEIDRHRCTASARVIRLRPTFAEIGVRVGQVAVLACRQQAGHHGGCGARTSGAARRSGRAGHQMIVRRERRHLQDEYILATERSLRSRRRISMSASAARSPCSHQRFQIGDGFRKRAVELPATSLMISVIATRTSGDIPPSTRALAGMPPRQVLRKRSPSGRQAEGVRASPAKSGLPTARSCCRSRVNPGSVGTIFVRSGSKRDRRNLPAIVGSRVRGPAVGIGSAFRPNKCRGRGRRSGRRPPFRDAWIRPARSNMA